MKTQKYFLFGFVLTAFMLAVAERFMPHPPNFTPVGAFALFIGFYVAKKCKWGVLLPLAAMFLSDLFIGFYDAKLMAVVYASFFAYSFIGLVLADRKNPATVVLGSMGGAFLFYLATNFAVWAFSPWYEKTFQGLLLSYTLALPFFKATLLGDLFFASMLFGAYEIAVSAMKWYSGFSKTLAVQGGENGKVYHAFVDRRCMEKPGVRGRASGR